MYLKINRNLCKLLAVLVAVLLLLLLLFAALDKWMESRETSPSSEEELLTDERVFFDGVPYVPRKHLDTVLLLGVDKYAAETKDTGYVNSQQTDFLLLLVMDRKAKSYTAVQLNRDTMTDMTILGVRGEKAGTVNAQLALAHTYGSGKGDSCRNAVEAVSGLLYNVHIDHYVSFTMDAVAQVNDIAGGVTLTVLDDMTSVSPKMVKGKSLTLTGNMALSYIRARQGLEDSSNLRRMERQRQYLEELRKTVTVKMDSDDSFLLETLEQVSPYIQSDCTVNQLASLYNNWNTYENGGIKTTKGEAKVGEEFMEFYPDKAALKQLVIDLFYDPVKE